MLLDIQTHLQSLPFADIVLLFLLIIFFGGLIAYSSVKEVEDLHKDDEEIEKPIETIITGSIGQVFNHIMFDDIEGSTKEDMD